MRLKIKVGNIEFEADGNENEVERERIAMIELLKHLSAVNASIALQSAIQDDNALLESNDAAADCQSFNEFLNSITVKRDTDIVMAAAYFLYKYRGAEYFTSKDIEETLTESHIKRPGNISQSITQNIKKGLVSLTKNGEGGLKTYQVLTTADDWYSNAKNNTN